MSAGRIALICAFAVAALLRLHNAWVALPLSGFDGPYHAAYIGIIHLDGRIPLGHESWSTYHPPLYYALCALLWKLLPESAGPHAVLFALRLVGVFAGLSIGLAVYRCARLLFPERPGIARYATVLVLFLPMLVGPASVIGNEILTAALAAWSVWWLLRCLAEPHALGCIFALGVCLGLAILSKFNALSVLGAAGVALLVRGVRSEGLRIRALRAPALVGLTVLCVSGGYFARNVLHYGTPLLLEVDLSADVMGRQGYGVSRPIRHYFTLHPDLLWNPADRSERVRRAVWPATFASVWFDLHGSQLSVQSDWGTRLARVLFGCGALFSVVALLGALALAQRRVRCALPLGGTVLALVAGFALASFCLLTRQVATFSVLKGTLLAPGVVAFAIATGVGCDGLARSGVAAARALWGVGVLFIASVCAILWVGWLAPTGVSPAVFYLQAFSDAPTRRVVDYFLREKPLRDLEFYSQP